jgi:hypothetical protein
MAFESPYRAIAKECLDVAGRTADLGRKLVLLELAQRWLQVAEEIAQINERNGLRDNLVSDGPSVNHINH